MKTNESKVRGWRLGGAGTLGLALLAGACGGSVHKPPSVGSESHFLAYCSGSCADGLDCIGGICTRSCLTQQGSCSDLAASARCTNASVEPGQVAVCDVSCSGAAECSALGSNYGCDAGFCRTPSSSPLGNAGSGGAAGSAGNSGSSGTGSSGTGSGGTGSGGGSVPNLDCRPVGRYEVGKEGGYLPCCPGLSELSTLLEATDEAGRRSCQQLPLRSYSCTEGSCGDGVCAEGEAPCGCGVDCPDSNWRASEASCETYRDQSPPPDVRVISIRNTGDAPLYLLPEPTDCGPPTSLVSVTRDGQRVDVSPPPACRTSCQSVIDAGWPYRPGQATPTCSSAICPSPAPVQILPGETLQHPTYLEVVPQQLPRYCAEGIASETIDCYTRAIPQPGNYTLTVRAALTNCGPSDDCNCDPDPSGACRNQNLPLRAPFLVDTPSAWYFQNQQIELSVRVD